MENRGWRMEDGRLRSDKNRGQRRGIWCCFMLVHVLGYWAGFGVPMMLVVEKVLKRKKTYTALVLTTLLPKSPARHECAAVLTGYLPKGWGSTIERAAVRIMARNGVADGIFVCIFVDS